jgi:hypothetical protein
MSSVDVRRKAPTPQRLNMEVLEERMLLALGYELEAAGCRWSEAEYRYICPGDSGALLGDSDAGYGSVDSYDDGLFGSVWDGYDMSGFGSLWDSGGMGGYGSGNDCLLFNGANCYTTDSNECRDALIDRLGQFANDAALGYCGSSGYGGYGNGSTGGYGDGFGGLFGSGYSDPFSGLFDPFGGYGSEFGDSFGLGGYGTDPWGNDSDPFGSYAVPWGGSLYGDPSWFGSDPFGFGSDPFGGIFGGSDGGDPFGAYTDPWGGNGSTLTDPFGLGGSGALDPGFFGNPYGNPFGLDPNFFDNLNLGGSIPAIDPGNCTYGLADGTIPHACFHNGQYVYPGEYGSSSEGYTEPFGSDGGSMQDPNNWDQIRNQLADYCAQVALTTSTQAMCNDTLGQIDNRPGGGFGGGTDSSGYGMGQYGLNGSGFGTGSQPSSNDPWGLSPGELFTHWNPNDPWSGPYGPSVPGNSGVPVAPGSPASPSGGWFGNLLNSMGLNVSLEGCGNLLNWGGCTNLGEAGWSLERQIGSSGISVGPDENGAWNIDGKVPALKVFHPALPYVGLKIDGSLGTSGGKGCIGGYVGSPAPTGGDLSLQGCLTGSPWLFNDARTWLNQKIDGAVDSVRDWIGGGRGFMGGNAQAPNRETSGNVSTLADPFGEQLWGRDDFNVSPDSDWFSPFAPIAGQTEFGGHQPLPFNGWKLPCFGTRPFSFITDVACGPVVDPIPNPGVDDFWVERPPMVCTLMGWDPFTQVDPNICNPWPGDPIEVLPIDEFPIDWPPITFPWQPCVPSYFNPETGISTMDCHPIRPIEEFPIDELPIDELPIDWPPITFPWQPCVPSYRNPETGISTMDCRRPIRPIVEPPVGIGPRGPEVGVCVIGVVSPCNGTNSELPEIAQVVTPAPIEPATNGGQQQVISAQTDRNAPVLVNMPKDIVLEATGTDGAVLEFALPTATDNADSSPEVRCTVPARSTVPLGLTTVHCAARDDAGNASPVASFKVTVRDTMAPTLTAMPRNLSAEMTNASGAAVEFELPSASDAVDRNVTVSCSARSGDRFVPGTTVVSCSAADDAGNTSTSSFTVTVRDSSGPRVTGVRLGGSATVSNVVITVSESLVPSTAGDVKNFSLLGSGKDKRLGTRDDKAIAIRSAVYDAALDTITLTPKKAIAMNQLVQLGVKSSVRDLAGNALDGDRDGRSGGDMSAIVGRGTQLAFTDSSGDQVSLGLTGGGAMELLAAGGTIQHLRLAGATGSSLLTGNVARSLGGDGKVTVEAISGLGSARNTLQINAAFDVHQVKTDVIDLLLASATM